LDSGAKSWEVSLISNVRGLVTPLTIVSSSLALTSPLKPPSSSSSRESSELLLQHIVEECMDNGVAIVTAKYLEDEVNLPPPRWVMWD